MKKFTNRQREAIKTYYSNARLFEDGINFIEKDKPECLEAIIASIKDSRNIKDLTACAGTFWFQWKDNTTTVHNEKNWWKMKRHVRGEW